MKPKITFIITILSLLSLTIIKAQSIITGIVIEAESQLPLPGVNIQIDGHVANTSSDQDGQYTFTNVPAGNYNIRFTFIGFETVLLKKLK